jgi:hypothetical protein
MDGWMERMDRIALNFPSMKKIGMGSVENSNTLLPSSIPIPQKLLTMGWMAPIGGNAWVNERFLLKKERIKKEGKGNRMDGGNGMDQNDVNWMGMTESKGGRLPKKCQCNFGQQSMMGG